LFRQYGGYDNHYGRGGGGGGEQSVSYLSVCWSFVLSVIIVCMFVNHCARYVNVHQTTNYMVINFEVVLIMHGV